MVTWTRYPVDLTITSVDGETASASIINVPSGPTYGLTAKGNTMMADVIGLVTAVPVPVDLTII